MPASRASPFGNGECFLRFEAGRPIVDQRNDFLGTTGAMEVGAVEGPAIWRSETCKRSRQSVWISQSPSFRFMR